MAKRNANKFELTQIAIEPSSGNVFAGYAPIGCLTMWWNRPRMKASCDSSLDAKKRARSRAPAKVAVPSERV